MDPELVSELVSELFSLTVFFAIAIGIELLIPLILYLTVYVNSKAQQKEEIQIFKRTGLDRLKGHWGQSIAAIVLFYIILSSGAIFATPILIYGLFTAQNVIILVLCILYAPLLILNPLIIGLDNFFLKLSNGDTKLQNLFAPFSTFWRNCGLMLLTMLFNILWLMLFIVPGIIKSYSYALVTYIRSEYPELTALETITLSRKMMDGNKLRLFRFTMSFYPWYLLSFATSGLIFLYAGPYFSTSSAELYKKIKAEYESKHGTITV